MKKKKITDCCSIKNEEEGFCLEENKGDVNVNLFNGVRP